MMEELTDEPEPGFDESRPWDYIIAQSSFDLSEKNHESGWWKMNLVAGLNSPQSTQSVIGRLIGRTPGSASFLGNVTRTPPPLGMRSEETMAARIEPSTRLPREITSRSATSSTKVPAVKEEPAPTA
jgi:hypothetical protein